jgi:hypothetical protein
MRSSLTAQFSRPMHSGLSVSRAERVGSADNSQSRVNLLTVECEKMFPWGTDSTLSICDFPPLRDRLWLI